MKTIHKSIGALALITVAALTAIISQTSWLQASIFDLSPDTSISGINQNFDDIREAFRNRMDEYLESSRPGEFDPYDCTYANEIEDLVDTRIHAWGIDDEGYDKLDEFTALATLEERKAFILTYINNSDVFIPYSLYESFINEYFQDDSIKLSFQKAIEEKGEGQSIPITMLLQKDDELNATVLNEAQAASTALSNSFIFLEEEYATAEIISGLCQIYNSSNTTRVSLMDLRSKLFEGDPPLIEVITRGEFKLTEVK